VLQCKALHCIALQQFNSLLRRPQNQIVCSFIYYVVLGTYLQYSMADTRPAGLPSMYYVRRKLPLPLEPAGAIPKEGTNLYWVFKLFIGSRSISASFLKWRCTITENPGLELPVARGAKICSACCDCWFAVAHFFQCDVLFPSLWSTLTF
jgi:hypothetical protein